MAVISKSVFGSISGKVGEGVAYELNGQYVWITDTHKGILAGNLKYIPLLQDKYFLGEAKKY